MASRLRMDSKGCKYGSRETKEEAVKLMQVRYDGGLDPGGNSGGGEKWLQSGYILEVETTG